ncbi:MAG TPA: hypothetical protein VL049_00515 [Candidatus Dormibacteraeota bacterium]|nr:hypothetical protein [Candidatus Dormibacteraeota bacterium]
MLTQTEFGDLVRCLADELGVQRLRDKLVAMRGLVTRRGAANAEALATQLWQLTGGLRRQVPASLALQGLWAEQVGSKLGEDGEKELEAIAEQINACLGERDSIVEGKESELDTLLGQYQAKLAEVVGAERARIDMLLKAVPAVAERLRAGGESAGG